MLQNMYCRTCKLVIACVLSNPCHRYSPERLRKCKVLQIRIEQINLQRSVPRLVYDWVVCIYLITRYVIGFLVEGQSVYKNHAKEYKKDIKRI